MRERGSEVEGERGGGGSEVEGVRWRGVREGGVSEVDGGTVTRRTYTYVYIVIFHGQNFANRIE